MHLAIRLASSSGVNLVTRNAVQGGSSADKAVDGTVHAFVYEDLRFLIASADGNRARYFVIEPFGSAG